MSVLFVIIVTVCDSRVTYTVLFVCEITVGRCPMERWLAVTMSSVQ